MHSVQQMHPVLQAHRHNPLQRFSLIMSEESQVTAIHTNPYGPLRCMPHNCNILKTLVDCSGYGTLSFMPLNADLQALHVLVRIMIMIFHSCQIRMLGLMTMLRGHKVLKKSGVQLKVGSKNGRSFYYLIMRHDNST
jgi:hypothetical protein